jgi:hypothetical protein
MSLVIPSPKRLHADDMPCIHPNAAGMDNGARHCRRRALHVTPSPCASSRRSRICMPLRPGWSGAVSTRSMASTGVYGVPVFELLEQCGIHPLW